MYVSDRYFLTASTEVCFLKLNRWFEYVDKNKKIISWKMKLSNFPRMQYKNDKKMIRKGKKKNESQIKHTCKA